MSLAADGMGVALGGLRRLAGLEVLDRLGIRDRVEELVYRTSRGGFSAVTATERQFVRASTALSGSRPARQTPVSGAGLFDLTPDDEQRMLVETFTDFAASHLRPAARQADDAQATPDELRGMATEVGAMVLGIPTDLGGVVDERSAVTSVLALEAMAHGDMGLTTGIMAPAAVSSVLSLYGDAEQQAAYLTPFTTEDPPVASLAVAEPRPLFDPRQLQTVARRDGDDLIIDGVKSLVPHVTAAELFCVAVHIESEGPALVLVESAAAGLAARPEPTMGVRAAASGELMLREVRVPSSAVIAEGDPTVYAEVLARWRIAWAAVAVGTGQAVLDYVIPYVTERKAFGEPIAHRQGVAFMVSNIAIEVEGLRLATYRAASLADQDKPFTRAAAIARQLATDKGMQIGSDGVQLLGGHGYVKEHPVERWYRDLRAAGLFDGGLLV